ncbi:hypothetical protein J4217_03430 [Candidatus Pacearchaeota archaeon]|nr:hypothetical protein [Candidatus Pacearchaeota archaeon]
MSNGLIVLEEAFAGKAFLDVTHNQSYIVMNCAGRDGFNAIAMNVLYLREGTEQRDIRYLNLILRDARMPELDRDRDSLTQTAQTPTQIVEAVQEEGRKAAQRANYLR